ncbi:MAG: M23 family metallopeptidase [Gemmatimonadota bacterium]|nr:M23 family metallopeptidase [Gemmatimonadota bacterium]
MPPPPAPALPFETPAESPAPIGAWSAGDPVADADVAWLRLTGLLVPVRGIPVATIEDSFDAPRDGGRRHDAVDIPAPRGTPVVAAVDGIILRVGTNALGGNVVWMADPENRFAYYYAHLDRFAKGLRAGAPVRRGALLGYVGTTGNAPPDVPHLHFQLMRTTDATRWWNGTPVNPVPFLTESLVAAPAGPRR